MKNYKCIDCGKPIWWGSSRCGSCAAKIKSVFKKGFTPWNKGKIGVMPPAWNKGTKGIMKAWSKGKHLSEETKLKISVSKKGQLPWVTGKNKYDYPQLANSGVKKGNTPWNKGKNYPNPKMSIIHKRLWQNKEYRERILNAQAKVRKTNGLSTLEKHMVEIINNHNLPYKFVGNGDFYIERKNPDFINILGKKECIEVANIFRHKWNYREERVSFFTKHGWKCYLFESKNNRLNEREVLSQLVEVNKIAIF